MAENQPDVPQPKEPSYAEKQLKYLPGRKIEKPKKITEYRKTTEPEKLEDTKAQKKVERKPREWDEFLTAEQLEEQEAQDALDAEIKKQKENSTLPQYATEQEAKDAVDKWIAKYKADRKKAKLNTPPKSAE